jgi:hypothetical protein
MPDARSLFLLLTSQILSYIYNTVYEENPENDDDRYKKRAYEPVRAIVPGSAPASADIPIARLLEFRDSKTKF